MHTIITDFTLPFTSSTTWPQEVIHRVIAVQCYDHTHTVMRTPRFDPLSKPAPNCSENFQDARLSNGLNQRRSPSDIHQGWLRNNRLSMCPCPPLTFKHYTQNAPSQSLDRLFTLSENRSGTLFVPHHVSTAQQVYEYSGTSTLALQAP